MRQLESDKYGNAMKRKLFSLLYTKENNLQNEENI